MEFKLNMQQIENYAPHIYDGAETDPEAFRKTAIDAVLVKLAEDVKGWDTYDVTKIDNMFPTYLYEIALDDENYTTLYRVTAWVDTDEKTVEVVVKPS